MPNNKIDRPQYEYPVPEPSYTSKVVRDLGPFDSALAEFRSERAAELDRILTTATIPDIQTMLASGALTSAELVTYYLDRIRRYDIDKLNSVMTINPAALSIAAALDEERASGRVCGPLHGIPVLIKDNIATGDGLPTTAGAYALRDWIPDRDAFLVQQLRQAGAIILGKTNLSEFANFMDPTMPNGFSTVGGQTQNPHGPFDPSGSSSGSSVAVAANFAAAAVGSETQGSIIMPAIANGLFGLKTSRGLVSRDYVVPLLEAQDVVGPLTRSAIDLAVMLTAMAGVDAHDPATAEAVALHGFDFMPFAAAEAGRNLRIGVPRNLAESSDILGDDAIMAALKAAGLTAVPVDADAVADIPRPDLMAILPYGFREDFDGFMTTLGDAAPVASLADVARLNAEDPANRCPYGQRSIISAVEADMTAAEFEAAVVTNRAMTAAAIDEVLTQNEIDILYLKNGQQYAAAGYPAVSIPWGVDENGRPQAMIFVGGYLSEPQLIAVAYALESALGGRPVPRL